MTLTKAVFGHAADDSPAEFELETFVSHKGEYIHYDTTYLSEPAARRLLIDCVHTLADEDEDPAEIVPAAFLEQLEDVLDDLVEEQKTMTEGVGPRMEAINRLRREFGLRD